MIPETKRRIKWICDRLADAQITNHQYLAEDAKGALEDCVVGIERLEKWIADLQSGMYVNCIYCGHRYGPGETTPVSMADALKAHAETCAKHPLSAARAQIESLAEELGDLEDEALRDLATISELRAEVGSRDILIARLKTEAHHGEATAPFSAAEPDMLAALKASTHALRSYQFGNASSELAEKIADQNDALLTSLAEGK